MRQPCAVVVSARALCNILNEQEIKPHKSVLYACGTLGSFQTFSKLSSLGAFTDSTQPADTYNASDDPCEMYFVTSRNFNFGGGQCVNGCNGLIVWGLYGTQPDHERRHSRHAGATRLGIGERQLRRLFRQHLGASPILDATRS